MNKLVLFIVLVFFLGCSKDGEGSGDKIKYEVQANSGTFWVQYLDETASPTQTNSTSNFWSIEFRNQAGKPRQVILWATSTVSPITLAIYINGSKVKSTSGSFADIVSYNMQ